MALREMCWAGSLQTWVLFSSLSRTSTVTLGKLPDHFFFFFAYSIHTVGKDNNTK